MTKTIEEKLTGKQRTLIMIPLLIGGFIAVLNDTILNVAFPQLESSLHVSTSTVQWLATAYMLTIGILVPAVAFLMETFTTKTMYLAAMTLFAIGTVGCGFSQSFPALLIFRIVQGAGTGMLVPIMTNTILEIYPPAKRGTVIGASMVVIIVAPAFGPTLSGLVLKYLNWHWLFFSILPVALLAMIIGGINLKNVSTLTKPKIDILSIVLSTIGFGGLIFGICSIESMGFNTLVLVSLLCGIIGLILFSRRQFTLKQPMLELRTFRYPMFTLGTIIMFIAFMIPFAVNIILPTYMQNTLGLTPFTSGLAMLPGGILCGVGTLLSGRFYDRIGAKPLLITGFALLTATMLFLSHISASTLLVMIITMHICVNLGLSLISTPAQTNILNQLSREENAHGVAILNTAQQIAAAFGSSLFIGLMGAVQTRYISKIQNPGISQQHAAAVSGVDIAFTAALAITVIGLILSFFIMRRKKETSDTSRT
ncbi:MAG: MDR family MFS transporter [Clostridiaceae bacterium]|nr:MDR family MFS transporter [Clostridiaceae bacterium]